MSRTELEAIAAIITANATGIYPTPQGYGTVYAGSYNRRPFLCIHDKLLGLCAVCYNRVMYLFIGTGTRPITYDIKALFKENNCEAAVYLYKNSANRLFRDEDGVFLSTRSSRKCDYRDVIPIPML